VTQRFAIVGMDAWLPGATSAEAWARLDTPVFREPPEGRWPGPPARGSGPDRVATTRGAFVDLPPTEGDLVGLDAMVARVARRARDGVARGRAGLVVAHLLLPSRDEAAATGAPVWAWAQRHGVSGTGLASTGALEPSDVGARVARALDLVAGASLDAACASGLHALATACARVASGAWDQGIAAGVSFADTAYLFLGFSALQALSPDGIARPFDRRANGLVVGEGAAAVVVERLEDALAWGHRPLAVIEGLGLGSDGRKGNLLAPDPAGQLRAMREAWRHARRDPSTMGYLECHATGTPVGDAAELHAARELVGTGRVAVGSAKGLAGHALVVAGLAGTIRAAHAVDRGQIPGLPWLEDPLPGIAGPLRASRTPEPWDERQRVAGVSAFGFGGTNAHLVLSRWTGDDASPAPAPRPPPPPPLAVVRAAAWIGAHTGSALIDALRARRTLTGTCPGARRLGVPPFGAWRATVAVDARRWRIPPVELAAMQPAQLAALDVGSLAGTGAPPTTSTVFATAVDPRVSRPVHRAALRAAGALDLADAVCGPLTASAVQGSLPNFPASRLAAALGLEGPAYAVAAGGTSGWEALDHAWEQIDRGATHALVVGSWSNDPGVPGNSPSCDAAVALLVRPLTDAERAGEAVLGVLHPSVARATDAASADRHRRLGDAGPAEALVALIDALARGADAAEAHGRAMSIERADRFTLISADVPADAVRAGDDRPLPDPPDWRPGARPTRRPSGDVRPATAPLDWPRVRAEGSAPTPAPAPTVPRPTPTVPAAPTAERGDLITAFARAQQAAVDAHARFLHHRSAAIAQLAALVDPTTAPPAAPPSPARPPVAAAAPPAPIAAAPVTPPARLTPDQVLAHAIGPLSEAFGPDYADLDDIRPRVRMPGPPLLLATRVLEIEGERGTLGPSRCVTEYDIPEGDDWSADGRPPTCVVVESGQADLLLVSWLGVDAITRGRSVYRLLDCDLTFADRRPQPGETLRHDIRIARFARLGPTLLFWFSYDCVAQDGRPILSMRNGCAGFFTPAELATPEGVRVPPFPAPAPPPVAPGPVPATLSDAALDAIARGEVSRAFGPAWASVDGTRLTPPDSRWRLLHRVTELTLGGPCGVGRLIAEQDLHDDDWFNPCHFVDDPCMPGTLMLEGCVQAVQLWMLAAGAAHGNPRAVFDPVPGLAARLRCRGQVVPGCRKLTYEARIRSYTGGPNPRAVADVLLWVDGTPVVLATDIGVDVHPSPLPLRPVPPAAMPLQVASAAPSDEAGRWPADPAAPVRGSDRVLEFSVGSAARGMSTHYAPFDEERRCPRMPGPPLLTLTAVEGVEGPAGEVAAPRRIAARWELPARPWWRADPTGSLPFVLLLEAALQPCGWLTAWQGAGIADGDGRYFRNLGGTITLRSDIRPGDPAVHVRATQTSVSASGDIRLEFFTSELRAGDALVADVQTHFGYFSASALDAQRGLPPEDAPTWPAEPIDRPLAGHPALPPGELGLLDRVTAWSPDGGAAGLGWAVAERAIHADDWFFVAHFWRDPVMPGSLGLEAAVQLARWALCQQLGPDAARATLALHQPMRWKYRGQIRPHVRQMRVTLEWTARTDDGGEAVAVIYADALPIYRLDGLRLTLPRPPTPPPAVVRPPPVAALLDALTVSEGAASGRLRVDPTVHPWLADHCPTVVIPAIPMAFALEIAAEVAAALRPDLRVIGVEDATAERWLHTGDGPFDLQVSATAAGETVVVTLSRHVDNPRYPRLSGPQVHWRGVVVLGPAWHPAEPAPAIAASAVDFDVRAYYDGGHTFHGPRLQAMTALTALGPDGARATLAPAADAELLGEGIPAFVLDPLLLDAASHAMLSAEPERWCEIGPGHLAYPTRVEGLRLFGPRPRGPVTATLRALPPASEGAPAIGFEVHLAGPNGPWCRYLWWEAVLPAGAVLSAPAAARRAFCWERVPAEIRVGRPEGEGWLVLPQDVTEPLPGTLERLYGDPVEHRARGQAGASLAAWVAAKEAVRSAWLAATGADVHPSDLVVVPLRPDAWACLESATLPPSGLTRHLHPTRVNIQTTTRADGAVCATVKRRTEPPA
jgi:3-oxoacyl-(acyl-carrier-protein) synthase/3-hydroxymyristoyl/3-hydroxydecanoyl-(acyl carrier protein) dehydratase